MDQIDSRQPAAALTSNGVHPISSEQAGFQRPSCLSPEALLLDRSVNITHGRVGGRDVQLLIWNRPVPSGLQTKAMRQCGVYAGGQIDHLLELVARRLSLIRWASYPLEVKRTYLTGQGQLDGVLNPWSLRYRCAISIRRKRQT